MALSGDSRGPRRSLRAQHIRKYSNKGIAVTAIQFQCDLLELLILRSEVIRKFRGSVCGAAHFVIMQIMSAGGFDPHETGIIFASLAGREGIRCARAVPFGRTVSTLYATL